MRDERDFARAMRDVCAGRFDLDCQPDDVQDCLLDLRWRGKTLLDRLRWPEWDTIDRCVFDVLASARSDAACRVVDGGAMLGLTIGLVQRAYAVAHALMSLPDFLPGVGRVNTRTPADEAYARAGRAIFGAAGDTAWDIRTVPSRQEPPSLAFARIIADDLDRCWAAHGIAGYYFQWVLYHEWMHAAAGHPQFLADVSGSPVATLALHENGAQPAVAPEWAHVVEFDADRRGSWRVCDELWDDQGVLLCALRRGTLDLPSRLRGWWAVNSAIFLILCDGVVDISCIRPPGHPHPLVRVWAIFARVDEDLKQRDSAAQQDWHATVSQTFKLLRRLWSAAGRAGDPFGGWQDNVNAVCEEVNELGHRHSQDLLPRLRPWDFFQRAVDANAHRADRPPQEM